MHFCSENSFLVVTGKSREALLIDLLMGLFRGAVFHPGGVPENYQLALMARFPILNGPFSGLNGPPPRMP